MIPFNCHIKVICLYVYWLSWINAIVILSNIIFFFFFFKEICNEAASSLDWQDCSVLLASWEPTFSPSTYLGPWTSLHLPTDPTSGCKTGQSQNVEPFANAYQKGHNSPKQMTRLIQDSRFQYKPESLDTLCACAEQNVLCLSCCRVRANSKVRRSTPNQWN